MCTVPTNKCESAKVPVNDCKLSLYSHFAVEKSVQPCGLRLVVVTCFADVRMISTDFEFISIPCALPFDGNNLVCFIFDQFSPENFKIGNSLFNKTFDGIECKDN